MSPEADVQAIHTLPDALTTAGALLACGLLAAPWPATAGPPEEPWVVDFDGAGKTVGKPGGELQTLVGRAKDTRLMVVYGYARLVGYDRELELVPDILKDVDIEDGRSFTLHLRKGHRGPTASRSPARTSATGGRTSPTTRR